MINVIQVVAGVICCNKKILICERPSNKPYANYWEFPGGKIEANETPFVALNRELKEELAINIQTGMPFITYDYQYPDKHVALNFWLVTDFTGIPTGCEGQRIEWVSYSQLLQKKLLAGNQKVLTKIQEYLS